MSGTLPTESQRKRVAEFLDSFRARGGNCASGVPPEIAIGPPLGDGWSEWKETKSPITQEDIDEIEESMEIRLPAPFVAYLTDRCILQGNTAVVSLPKISTVEPLRDLLGYLEMYEPGYFWHRVGLLPFAWFSDDSGFACFKLSERNDAGDCPIYFMDIVFVGKPGKFGEKRWDSFVEMLDFIQRLIESYD